MTSSVIALCSLAVLCAGAATAAAADGVTPRGSFVREIAGCENNSSDFSSVLRVNNVTLSVESMFSLSLTWSWEIDKHCLIKDKNTSLSETSIFLKIFEDGFNRDRSAVDCRTFLFNVTAAVMNSQWTGSVQYNLDISHYQDATYHILLVPSYNEDDGIAEDDRGHTLIVINNTVVLAIAQRSSCEGSDVFMAAAFPDDASLAILGLNETLQTSDLPTSFNATFHGLQAGVYKLYAAPEKWSTQSCPCGSDVNDHDCHPCGNFVSRHQYSVNGSRKLVLWNATMNATLEHHASEHGCYILQVSFSPSMNVPGFHSYNFRIIDDRSPMADYSSFVWTTCDKETFDIEKKICNSSLDNVTIEVTPVGGCPGSKISAQLRTHSADPMGVIKPRSMSMVQASNLPGVAAGSVAGAIVASLLTLLIICILTLYFKGCLAHTMTRGIAFARQQVPNSKACSESSKFPDVSSKHEGMDVLFGGGGPEVLLLYSCDNNLHVKIVHLFAEMLCNFGGCKVILDKWCDPETVQMSDWLHRRACSADRVIIIASAGASMLYTARTAWKFYPKYDLKYPCSNHVTDALVLASKCPIVRLKMCFVKFVYSSDNCLPVLSGFTEQQCFLFPEEMPSLIGILHGATEPYEWSCKKDFEMSQQLQAARKLVQKMQHKVSQRPGYLADTFGHAEEWFDSGIEQSGMLESWEGSAGMTEAFTIVGPADPSATWTYALHKSDLPKRESSAAHGLRTDMPRMEEIWNAYIDPEPSAAGFLTSAELVAALRRLNSNSSEESEAGFRESCHGFGPKCADLSSYETASTYMS